MESGAVGEQTLDEQIRELTEQVALDRRAAVDRTAETGLRLAASLAALARLQLGTGAGETARAGAAAALEPAQEAVLIRLHWLAHGRTSAREAGAVTDALRLFEQATRAIGHRELATNTIRQACDAYRYAAQRYPAAAGVCADGLSKCGVWLCRLDPDVAVAASEEAVRIRAGLFAANPEQSARYLASLNMLLRTLMIGRGRKQALAMYRERYAAWTSPEMTTRLRETSVDELDFTIKTAKALAKLECRTLDRAGYLTQQSILYQTDGDLTTIEEINWKLGLVGLKPLAAGALADPPSKPVEISSSFGALGVRCNEPDALNKVRDAVIAAYAADGAALTESDVVRNGHESHWRSPDPLLNTDTVMGADVVLLERSGGWISVKSLHWELTPVGGNPLARRLSRRWPVIAVNATENIAYELCRYDDGRATEYAALGRPAGQAALDTPLAPLNFAALAEFGADYASETQVRSAFGNSNLFAKVTELPLSGIRQTGSDRVSGFGSSILFFRNGSGARRNG